MRTASGVLETIWPSKPAVLMRSPICSAWTAICVGVGSVMAIDLAECVQLFDDGAAAGGRGGCATPLNPFGFCIRIAAWLICVEPFMMHDRISTKFESGRSPDGPTRRQRCVLR